MIRTLHAPSRVTARYSGLHRALFSSKQTTDFGFRDVPYTDKEQMVRQVFSSVAHNYDILNDLMSFGLHRLWKDDFVRSIGIPSYANIHSARPRILDVAGGTGDIAFRIINDLHRSGLMTGSAEQSEQEDQRQVIISDINPNMLQVGRDRLSQRFTEEVRQQIGFVEANAESLPFESDSFDLYTIAFGLRNVTNKEAALKEAHRVLKRGGRFMCMEFSEVSLPVIKQIYDQFSFRVIPEVGQIVAKDRDSYQYLVESIRMFPNQETMKQMVADAGFKAASYKNYTFGVVAVHSGIKL